MKLRLLYVIDLSTGVILARKPRKAKTSEQINQFLGQLQINQTGFQSVEKTIWDISDVFENTRSWGVRIWMFNFLQLWSKESARFQAIMRSILYPHLF